MIAQRVRIALSPHSSKLFYPAVPSYLELAFPTQLQSTDCPPPSGSYPISSNKSPTLARYLPINTRRTPSNHPGRCQRHHPGNHRPKPTGPPNHPHNLRHRHDHRPPPRHHHLRDGPQLHSLRCEGPQTRPTTSPDRHLHHRYLCWCARCAALDGAAVSRAAVGSAQR